MVNVYGNYSETGYNNPYSAPTPTTTAQADAGNVVGNRNRAAISGAPIGSRYGPEAGSYDWSGVSFEGQQQQQRQQQQPSNEIQVRVVANPNEGPAYQMATDAARRGEVVDPTVLQKAREQGFTGQVNATPSITPGAASRLASTRPVSARGNLYADADAFTPRTATFIEKREIPRFSSVPGSLTQRLAFDEFGKVLKGGKFEPAYNNTNVPFNSKMGAGEYEYIGEFKYNTGEVVSRYREKNVGSFVDFSEQGAMGYKTLGIRSGGSPGSYGETNQPLPAPFISTPQTSIFKTDTQLLAEKANTKSTISPLDIRADALDQRDATGGMQFDWAAKRPFASSLNGAGVSVEQPRGELPYVGVVPGVSRVVAFFQPEIIRQRQQTQLPDVVESKVSQLPERKEVTLTPIPDQVITEYDPGSRTTTTTTIKGVQEETTTYGGTLTETAVVGGVATSVSERTGQSGFEKFEQSIRNLLPSPEKGERAVQVAMLANPLTGVQSGVSLISEKITPKNTESLQSLEPNRGVYTFIYEHPTAGAISYGVGAVFRGGVGLLSKADSVSRAAVAEKLISQGGVWRSAEQISSGALRYAPEVLKWGYVGTVAYRGTEGGTDLNPATVLPRTRGIAVVEMGPMTMGYERAGSTVSSIKTSNEGFVKARAEGATTGRADYYIRQPVANRVELVKQDYAAFVQEGTVRQTPATIGSTRQAKIFDTATGKVAEVRTITREGNVNYAADNIRQTGVADNMGIDQVVTKPGKFDYVVEKLGLNKAPDPEPTTIVQQKYTGNQPISFEPNVNVKAYGEPWKEITPKAEPTTISPYKYTREGATVEPNVNAVAYKPQRIFDAATGKPVQEVNILDKIGTITMRGNQPVGRPTILASGETTVIEPQLFRGITDAKGNTLSRTAYPEKSQTLGIKIKTYLQENPITPETRATSPIKLFRPTEEIVRLNRLAEFEKLYTPNEFGSAGSIGSVKPTTPVSPTTPVVDAGRVSGTRIVGGRETPALSREPSLRSQGIESKAESGKTQKIGSRIDFRKGGETKQASIQIEQGQAPTRMVAPERLSQPPSFGFDILQVRNQERTGRVMVDVTPEFASSQVTDQTIAQASRQKFRTSEVVDRAQKQQIGPTILRTQGNAQTDLTRSRQGIETSSGIKTDLTSGQDFRQSSDISQRFTQTQVPKVTTTIDPFKDYNQQITVTRTPGIPLGFPMPDGAPYNTGGRKRRRNFLEIFPMGLDLQMFGKKTLPRRVGRKPPKEKRKTSSKKGRK